ncbi:MAG: hypothetical protein ACYDGN_13175 [Acidimicrobiales bacterium]
MDDILEVADRVWRGETPIGWQHPLQMVGGLSEVGDRTAYVASFARVSSPGLPPSRVSRTRQVVLRRGV